MSEHDEQVAVINWCFEHVYQYPELDLIFAIPNGAMLGGGRIGAIRMNALKAEGLRPGVCDLFLPAARGVWHGMFVEMKTLTGTLHPNQQEFISAVTLEGYYVAVCYGVEKTVKSLEFYLSHKKAK